LSAIAVIVPLVALAMGLGALAMVRLASGNWTRLEVALHSLGLGLGIIAYTVLALGLTGHLHARGALALALALAVPSAIGWSVFLRFRASPSGSATADNAPRWVVASALLIVGVSLISAFIDCFVPPAAHEWDSLSYHLAAPKAFIMAGRMIELPTDHHSYFPFLTQMLFTVGLLFDGFAAAKLIHLTFAVMAGCATYALARRLTSATGAWLAVLAFATAPMVVWEAGIAYIELAQTFYVILGLHGMALLLQSRRPADGAASGLAFGLALAVKTLSLIPFAASAIVALHRVRSPRLWSPLLAGAVLLGCPFYIRTWALTGNPVYPFAYSVFGGKNWDAERARLYSGEQIGFGLNASLPSLSDDLGPSRPRYRTPSPADRLRNLALAPFALIASPRIFHNYNDPGWHVSLGFLWLALLPTVLLCPSHRPAWVAPIAGVLGMWYVVWSVSMQYARYLIPALPLALVVGASGAICIARVSRLVRIALVLTVMIQALTLWAHLIPRALDQAPRVVSPSAAEDFVTRQVNVYSAQQWLNRNSGPADGVVLFEETRGYYLDRPVLWGNSPHSAYVPYRSFRGSREMAAWFLRHGVRYALINLQFAPQAATEIGAHELRNAVRDSSEAALLLRWYGLQSPSQEPWRPMIAQALTHGDAVFVPEASANGAVVLRFMDRGGPSR
jgi:hypothetical protein